MQEVLVNRLGGLSLPKKSVVRLTDRPDMTIDVYCGRKTTIQQQQYIFRHPFDCQIIYLINPSTTSNSTSVDKLIYHITKFILFMTPASFVTGYRLGISYTCTALRYKLAFATK